MQNTHDLIWFRKSYRNCLISFLIQRRKILYSNWKHLFPNSGDEKVWIFTSCVFLGKSLPSLGLIEARVIWTRPASQILWYDAHSFQSMLIHKVLQSFPGGSNGKASACSAGDPGLIPRWGRSRGKRNSNPLQYSFLENSMDRGAWQATVHGVAKSQTRLSDFTHNGVYL